MRKFLDDTKENDDTAIAFLIFVVYLIHGLWKYRKAIGRELLK